jgi:hypothetical protein
MFDRLSKFLMRRFDNPLTVLCAYVVVIASNIEITDKFFQLQVSAGCIGSLALIGPEVLVYSLSHLI